jgi:GNAT superfamily N-acetyltransferase
MAVHANYRNSGCGKALLGHVERWLAGQGAKLLEVKTLASLHPSIEYAATRAFYSSQGFVPLEVFAELWSREHPCLQMVKVLVT